MVKTYTILGSLASLLLIVLLVGCTSPESNPPAAVPVFVDYEPLDMSATTIAPRTDGKPWGVESDWTIDAGRSVTIMAGTQIVFRDSVSVIVNGQILASGSMNEPIQFTSARVVPDMGDWKNFKLNNSTDASVFEYCIMTYGAQAPLDTSSDDYKYYRGMIACRDASPTVKNCIIARNQDNAVYMTGGLCHPTVKYNIFTKNDASAVRADTLVPLDQVNVSYNCVGDNSTLPFLMGFDTTRWGVKAQINANRDTCDAFFNIDAAPLFLFDIPDFTLSSCSPCIDAGPVGQDMDGDGTRRDFGVHPYVQQGAGDLRGVISGALEADVPYNMSCHVKIDSGASLTIPAGTVITVDPAEEYSISVYGRLVVEGTETNRVTIICGSSARRWGGIQFFGLDTVSAPSVLRNVDFVNFKQIDVARGGVEFIGCRFDSCFEYGVRVNTGGLDWSDTVSFSGCAFHNAGAYAIWGDSCAVTVRNTLIRDGHGQGVVLSYCGTTAALTNNIIHHCAGTAISLEHFCSPQVYNNVLTTNEYFGLHMNDNCGPIVENNIIAWNGRYGIWVQNSSQPTVTYNNVFGNTPDYLPESLNHPNSLSLDPQFAGGDDFHLGSGSPCIDAGDPAPQFNDADNTRNDMGAYGGPGGGSVGLLRTRSGLRPLASQ